MNKNIEGFFVEINLRNKKKWLLSCSYNPTKMQISKHLAELSKFLGPKIWESLPNDLKNKKSVDNFKTAIKRWRSESCPCRLVKRIYRT